MKIRTGLLLSSVALVLLVPAVQGHFKLLEPASWIEENNLGDPQKLGPCGGTSANPGKPTNAITPAKGGSALHIKLMETIYHPGHYRISLGVNGVSDLPTDPEVATRENEKGPWAISAKINPSPAPPVLIDNLWPHYVKPATPFETDIQLPNINCPKCVLQIIEFMAEHGYNKDGGYIYHHCANLNITADPAKPADKRWPEAR